MDKPLIWMALAVFAIGILFMFHTLKKEIDRENMPPELKLVARIEARLEYDRHSGDLFYIIENMGEVAAHDVRVYLPRCHEVVSSRRSRSAPQIAAGISKVMLQTYGKLKPHEAVEIPLLQLPPVEESAKDIFGLGLDVEARWANRQGDITKTDNILPISSRARQKLQAYA